MSPIYLVDYGVNNIGSIVNIIKKVGGESIVINTPDQIPFKGKVILPGIGSFDAAMQNLINGNWIDPLTKFIDNDRNFLLGICLGMQLMTNKSEEGSIEGLGFLDAETKLFDFNKKGLKLRIPHMGWNSLNITKPNNFFDTNIEQKFYFANSYHVVCNDPLDVMTTTSYGYSFVSSFQKNNIIGVQFHPEKSHKFGYHFFENFIKE